MSDFLSRYDAVLAVVLLGCGAVYFLLPQVHGGRPRLGIFLGAAALVVAGRLLIHNETPVPETLLFYAFSGVAIVGGCLMLNQQNPVHAALSFALVVLSTCGLFLLLAAPFLMAATIIVYAGAIIVTFLFVIMLAQQAGLSSADQRSREPFLSSLAGFLLMGALLCVLEKTYDSRDMDAILERVKKVADARTSAQIKEILGDPAKAAEGKVTLPMREELEKAFPKFKEEITAAEPAWNQMDVKALSAIFKKIYDHGRHERLQKGILEGKEDLPVSLFSQGPKNRETGKPELPAANVAGLGRTLFTDYLLPVELAGTLLLVASIGAIAIAGRRSEELR